MRYLFFDTESSNCFGNIYKMCEFGRLITDTQFKVLPGKKRDVLINPGRDGKFNLIGRKGGRDLILAHDYAEYKEAPLFDDLYENIKFLLSQKDVKIFLWASENDIKALLDQCFRYRLPKISFVSYDVQALYKAAMPEVKGTPSLEKAASSLGIDLFGISQHRPDDDALVTMLILKALCEKTGKTPLELVQECPGSEMESKSTYFAMAKRHREKAERKRLDEARKKALAPFNAELNALFEQDIPDGVPRERIFSVSLKMKEHIDETLTQIKGWLSKGYFLKRNLGAAYLVYYDEEEMEKLASCLDLSVLRLVSIVDFDIITEASTQAEAAPL